MTILKRNVLNTLVFQVGSESVGLVSVSYSQAVILERVLGDE